MVGRLAGPPVGPGPTHLRTYLSGTPLTMYNPPPAVSGPPSVPLHLYSPPLLPSTRPTLNSMHPQKGPSVSLQHLHLLLLPPLLRASTTDLDRFPPMCDVKVLTCDRTHPFVGKENQRMGNPWSPIGPPVGAPVAGRPDVRRLYQPAYSRTQQPARTQQRKLPAALRALY